MSRFVRRWANWGTPDGGEAAAPEFIAEKPSQRTDKADKRTSVGFVSGQPERSGPNPGGGVPPLDSESSTKTPSQRTDKTDKTPSVSFVSAQNAHHEAVSGAGRCDRCQDLDAQGVRILFCSTCGRIGDHPPAPQPQPRDLAYPLAYVRQHAPGLPPIYRERFDYWLDLFLDAGWTQEHAERAAFRRVMLSPPAPCG